MKKVRIMFVCLGNICRSPMAEFLFKDMVKKAGREAEFEIASAATHDDNVFNGRGAPVYPPVKALLAKMGISCDEKRAQMLQATDGEKYDLFLCMDDDNVYYTRRILGERYANKCKKLLSFAGESGNVADPWFTRDFSLAYADIKRGLDGLLKRV